MEAIGSMLEHPDLVVDAFQSAIGDAQANGCEYSVAVLAQRGSNLLERGELRAGRPSQPGVQVGRCRRGRAGVERPQLLLEQVRPVDAGVETSDLAEPEAFVFAEILRCLEE